MKESKDSLTNNSAANNTFIFFAFILSILGFFDTAYLTIIHYKNVIPPCSIAHGCEKVLTSSFSTLYGIPIQIFGMMFYITGIILLTLLLQTGRKIFFSLFSLLSICGLAVSALLFSLQAFVIHAFCQYCLASEVFILLMSVSCLLHFIKKAL